MSEPSRPEDRRRHAGAERGEDPGDDRRGDPARLGRRDHPRRRPLHRRDREARARARRSRGLASAQRRIRRQPEDLLSGGAAARCGDRGHVASGRPVRAEPDSEADRADRGGRGRPRARYPDGRARRGPRGRHAPVQAGRQPGADHSRERRPADRAHRSAHGLSRLQSRGPAHGPVPAQLDRLRLRFGAADAGIALRLPDRRGPARRPATSTTRPRSSSGRRPSTDCRRSAPPGACSFTGRICFRRGSSRLDRGPRGRADHRRAGDDARGRLQPHLAAARGRLSGMRTAAAAGAAAGPRLRGRPQLRAAGAP